MIDELIIVSCICGWVILGWYYYGLRIQVKAQQTHIEQLQFYQTLFEQVPLNLTCYQLDGHIQAMNQAARVFWGVQSEHFESIRQQYNLFDDAQLQQSGMDALIRKAFAGNIVSMPDMHYLPEQTPSLEDKRLISRDVRGHLYPIKHQGTVIGVVLQHEDVTTLNPAWIELEITESLLLANLDQILPKMQRLRRAGIRFSIDDFGTGYSSLSYLKRLPLSRLKIDQSFVRDIEADPDDAAIVETIITMAKLLKLGVVAEGVETVGQYAFLRQHGFEYFQGYYFHRPLSLAQFDQLLVHCDFQPACGAFLPQLS